MISLKFYLSIVLIFTTTDAVMEQKLLCVVFRHGDRTPVKPAEFYPDDPHLNNPFAPYGDGQLTNVGRRRAYDLGVNIRKWYGSFLGDQYLPYKVVAQSTDVDRTKMSLQLVLAGLFPPVDDQRWSDTLNWQPVVVSSKPESLDFLMKGEVCPKYKAELKRIEELEEVKKKWASFSELSRNMSDCTGKNLTIRQIFDIYHGFVAKVGLNLSLPDWAEEIFPHRDFLNFMGFYYITRSYNENLRRLFGGQMIRNFTDTMTAVSQNPDNQLKLILLSGHETSVATVLLTLGVFEPHVPEYSSGVFFELLRNSTDNSFHVDVYYYLGIPATRRQLKIPGCRVPCLLDDFKRVLTNVLPTDDEQLCK